MKFWFDPESKLIRLVAVSVEIALVLFCLFVVENIV